MPFVEYPQRAIGFTIKKRLGKPNMFGWIIPGWSEFGDDNIFTGVYQTRRRRKGNGISAPIIFGKPTNFMQRPAWPSQPPSEARTAQQTKFKNALISWQNLTQEQKDFWNTKADKQRKRGYDYYMRRVLLGEIPI